MTDKQPEDLVYVVSTIEAGKIARHNCYGFDISDKEDRQIASTLFSIVDAATTLNDARDVEWGASFGQLKPLCQSAAASGVRFEDLFELAVQQDDFKDLKDFDYSLRNSRALFAPYDVFLLVTASRDRNRVDDQFFALVVSKPDGTKFPLVLAQRQYSGFQVRYNVKDAKHITGPFLSGSPVVRDAHPHLRCIPS